MGMMKFGQLAHIACDVIIGMIERGEVPMRQAWCALRGGMRWKRIIDAGFRRADDKARRCAGTCAGCPASTREKHELKVGGKLTKLESGWCGRRLEKSDHGPEGGGPTCGCLVFVTMDGDTLPAGKTDADEQRWRYSLPEKELQEDIAAWGLLGCPRGLWS